MSLSLDMILGREENVLFLLCLLCTLRRINPCVPFASDSIKLNMMWMEKVKKIMI